MRNVAILLGIEGTSDRAVRAVGSVSLSLFLIIALMTLRIVDLATVAGPLLLIILVNSLATAAFAYFLTFRYMGGDYDAAAISGGQVADAALADVAVEAVLDVLFAGHRIDNARTARISRERALTGATVPLHTGASRFFAQATGDGPATEREPVTKEAVAR